VQQLLVENLQALLPGDRIVLSPWPVGMNPDVSVSFRFHELIGTDGRKMLLNATWDMDCLGPCARIHSHRIDLAEPMRGASYDELAAAHSRVLAALCRRVAESLQSWSPPKKPCP
jgi:uncharacterized lipoprotein YmbA